MDKSYFAVVVRHDGYGLVLTDWETDREVRYPSIVSATAKIKRYTAVQRAIAGRCLFNRGEVYRVGCSENESPVAVIPLS